MGNPRQDPLDPVRTVCPHSAGVPSHFDVQHGCTVNGIEVLNNQCRILHLYEPDILNADPGRSIRRSRGKHANLLAVQSSLENRSDGAGSVKVIDYRQVAFFFQSIHESLLGRKQLDLGCLAASAPAEITLVSFLQVDDNADGMDLNRRHVTEETPAANRLSIDNLDFFFSANFAAFRATGIIVNFHWELVVLRIGVV